MQILSSILVSFFLFDSMQAVTVPAKSMTSYASDGKGELTVIVEKQDVIGSVPRSATRVPLLALHVSASCEQDITIDHVEVLHVGLGRAADISSVYVMSGTRRLTRVARFDQKSQTAVLRFRSFTIPKCEAVSLGIHGDFSAEAEVASEHGLKIVSASAVGSTAKQTTLHQSNEVAKVVSVPTNTGDINVRFLPVTGRVSYGRRETVARVQLSADSRSGHVLKSVVFTNTGEARDMDLQWLRLETVSGTILTTATPRMQGYTARLQWNPSYILPAGKAVVLKLTAEIKGSPQKKINFILEESSDLIAVPYRSR